MAINSYRASGQNQYGQMTDLDRRGAQINDANAQRRAAVQDQDWMLQNMLRQEATQKQQADRGFANADRSFGEGVRQFDTQTANQSGQFDKTLNRQGEQFDKNFLQQAQQFDTRTGQVDREFNENKSRYDSDPNRLKGKWINDQLGITGNGGWNPTDEAGRRELTTLALTGRAPEPSWKERAQNELTIQMGDKAISQGDYALAARIYKAAGINPPEGFADQKATMDQSVTRPGFQVAQDASTSSAKNVVFDLAERGGTEDIDAAAQQLLVDGIKAWQANGQTNVPIDRIRDEVIKSLSDQFIAAANDPAAPPSSDFYAKEMIRYLQTQRRGFK